jgi:outer membrane protein TolC
MGQYRTRLSLVTRTIAVSRGTDVVGRASTQYALDVQREVAQDRPAMTSALLPRRHLLGVALALAACTLPARPALALQPVTEFLTHARTWNPQNRAAHATTAQRDAEEAISTGALLPNFSGAFTYTQNQYEVTTAALLPAGAATGGITIPNEVIQPQNQVDGNLIITVPLINIYSWDRRKAAQATLAGARADEANSVLMVEKNVLRDYYTLLGDEAVLLSATTNLEVAQRHVKLARDRKESGTGSELDVQRALADQAKAEQSVTAAQLGVINTRRDLYTLSGLEATPASAFPEDDLHEEGPLAKWTGKTSGVPSVESAQASRETAEQSARAVKAALLPTLAGVAEEKFTNATAFTGGHSAIYLFQITASWKLDTTILPQGRAQDAAVAAARANEEHARQVAEDAVFHDWQQVRSDIEAARSSRAQVAATRLAASLADDRYQAGVATQLDVLQARQDAFAADVARIQADADLAYARQALRLDVRQLAEETR